MLWNLVKQWSHCLGSFYYTFSKPIVAMYDKKKHNVQCGKMLYDQEMIYERTIGLMSSNRSVPIDTCVITGMVFQ